MNLRAQRQFAFGLSKVELIQAIQGEYPLVTLIQRMPVTGAGVTVTLSLEGDAVVFHWREEDREFPKERLTSDKETG